VPPEDYVVVVQPLGYAEYRYGTVTLTGGQTSSLRMEYSGKRKS
jgi:hypothetical protein